VENKLSSIDGQFRVAPQLTVVDEYGSTLLPEEAKIRWFSAAMLLKSAR
jgi:hypothetical protein